MPEDLTKKLDALADREHRSRSAQVILILEEWFDRQVIKKDKGREVK